MWVAGHLAATRSRSKFVEQDRSLNFKWNLYFVHTYAEVQRFIFMISLFYSSVLCRISILIGTQFCKSKSAPLIYYLVQINL